MSDAPRQTHVPVGPLVAAVGAILLVVSLFLNWYEGLTGFTVFELVDVVLLLCAVVVILQLAGGIGVVPRPPVSPAVSLAVTLFAIIIVVVQIINDPPAVAGGNGPARDVGIWLALGGAGLMVIGAILATAHISLSVEPRSVESEATHQDDRSEDPTRVDRP